MVNKGKLFVVYNGHGNETGYSQTYSAKEVENMKNGNKTTFVYKCKSCGQIIPKDAPTAAEVEQAAKVLLVAIDSYKLTHFQGPNDINKLPDDKANERISVKNTAEFLIAFPEAYPKALERSKQRISQNRKRFTNRSNSRFLG